MAGQEVLAVKSDLQCCRVILFVADCNLHSQLSVKSLQLGDGRMIPASKYGQADEEKAAIELTDEEKEMEKKLIVSSGLGRLHNFMLCFVWSGTSSQQTLKIGNLNAIGMKTGAVFLCFHAHSVYCKSLWVPMLQRGCILPYLVLPPPPPPPKFIELNSIWQM